MEQESERLQLSEMIAPNILGASAAFVKKVLLLQMFNNTLNDERLNILLVGDVSSGKTQIGYDVSKMVPKGKYISKKVTEVGFHETAIMCNGGMLVVDEFDKIPRSVRYALLDIMELGRVIITKHNSPAFEYDAYTNILAMCNPVRENIVRGMGILAQIPKFAEVEKSRFHLILPVYAIDPSYFREIARNIAGKLRGLIQTSTRQIEVSNMVVQSKRNFPRIDIPDKIADGVGDLTEELKTTTDMGVIAGPRLEYGIMSAICSNARIHGRHTAIAEDYKYVQDIFRKVYYERYDF